MANVSVCRGLLVASRWRIHMRAASSRTIRLPPMPTIRDLLLLYKLRAQKHLSQNFLLDSRLINKIAMATKFKSRSLEGMYAVEVGPGPGGISRALLNNGAEHVTVIEKDQRFRPTLEMLQEACQGRMSIYWGDVLSFDMSMLFPEEMRLDWEEGELHLDQEGKEFTKEEEEEEEWRPHRGKRLKGRKPKLLVIGNLPFNISTPLIIRWMRDVSNRKNIWSYGRVPMTLTFQKEVAERIVAKVGEFQRCRLSVMCQNWCYVDHKFNIPGSAFIPKPQVDVGVVRLVPRPEPIISLPFPMVEKVIRTLFSSRQKFIKHTAPNLFPPSKGDDARFPSREDMTDEFFLISGVNPNIRSFRTTLEEFKKLCGAYNTMCSRYPNLEKYEFRDPKAEEFLYGEDDSNEEELEKKWEGFDDATGKFDSKICSSAV